MTPVKNNTRLQINIRVGVLLSLFILFGVLILGKIIYLQYFETEKDRAEANNYTYEEKIMSERGSIYDAKNKLLATSVNTYDIYMDLAVKPLTNKIFNDNIDSLCFLLGEMFYADSITAEDFKTRLTEGREKKRRFVEIAKNLSFEDYFKIRKFPIFRRGQYKGGFIVHKETTRELPFKRLMYRTIGDMKKDDIIKTWHGRVGLEKYYEPILAGIPGSGWMLKLPNSSKMPVSGIDYTEAPIPGKDLILGIDINLQDYAHKVLAKQLKKHDAEYGVVILMEVKTGNVVAMVNLQQDRTDTLNTVYTEQFNHAIASNLEPGSTFKLPIMIAAMENRPNMSLTDTINVERGYKKYGNFVFRDSYFYGNTKKTIFDVFRHSSNVGMSKVTTRSYGTDYNAFADHLYAMGVVQKCQIDIEGEERPYIKSSTSKDWSTVTILQMSIGYEVRLSPMQLLTFYNAVANNGVMLKPRLVKAYAKDGEIIEHLPIDTLNHAICTQETLHKVQKLLLAVVDSGTARSIRTKRYKIAGKTGTTKYYEEGVGYGGEYRGSFVGYFPADRPKYSCIVVINRPKGDYYGSKVAAPVFKKIADKLYSYDPDMNTKPLKKKKIAEAPISKNGHKKDTDFVLESLNFSSENAEPINSEWVKTAKLKNTIAYKNYTIRKGLTPSVKGMGAKDAIFLLESLGLKTKIKGRGTVKKQSIPQGRKIKKGAVIRLTLK